MKVIKSFDILNNVFMAKISVSEMSDEEKAIFTDFPSKVKLQKLDTNKKVTVVNGLPTISEDGETVAVPVPTQEIPITSNFIVKYNADINRIDNSELTDTLNTKELVAQARCIVFAEAIIDELKTALHDNLSKAPTFTGEIEEEI